MFLMAVNNRICQSKGHIMKIGFGLILASASVLAAFLLLLSVEQCQAETPYAGRLSGDIKMIVKSRAGMQDVILFMDEHPDFFGGSNSGEKQLLDRDERATARQIWMRFLDHVILLDSLGALYSEIYREAKGKKQKGETFVLSFAAFLTEYRYAMGFIERVEKNPALHVILNEPMGALGIEKNSYSLLKYRFLNIIRGAEFARLNVLYKYYGIEEGYPLKAGMEEDINVIWHAGRGKGPELTVKNAGRVVADLGFTAWFPVQKGVAKLMGNTKVWRPGRTLISQAQIDGFRQMLEPGDILLERREWYASNVGIPGFWPHAALYIGSVDERRKYFTEPEVQNWVLAEGATDGNLETLLKRRYPKAYEKSITLQREGHMPRVVEAMEEGVSFTTLEHSAAADSLVILRPLLPKTAKARAVLRSFHYSGRPYDFNFDFRTDSALVCSELVYKAYEKTNGAPGLGLPTAKVMGRQLLSPNDIARLFAEEHGRENSQLELVYFLDGNEMKQQAFQADVEEFITSWERPKWHIWAQGLDELAGQ
jgi:hypothetical protein